MNSKETKEKFITAVCVLLFIGLLIFAGNVIIIANQIQMATNAYVAYAFYAVVLGLLGYYVARPAFKLVKMPPITEFKQINDKISDEDLRKVGERLKSDDEKDNEFCKNFDYYNSSSSYKPKQIENVNGEIKRRFQLIEDEIRNSSIKAGVLTAISQNSKIDAVSVLIVNFKMIYKLITLAGFRPNNIQLLKIYWRILSAGVFAYALSETFNLASDSVGGEVTEKIASAFAGKVTKSVSDGIINGLLTWRLGYVTKKFLELGEEGFAKEDSKIIYQDARKSVFDNDMIGFLKGKLG